MSQPKLVMQANGLVKRYGQVTALDGADFELRAGEILGIAGVSGNGQQALMAALSGEDLRAQPRSIFCNSAGRASVVKSRSFSSRPSSASRTLPPTRYRS